MHYLLLSYAALTSFLAFIFAVIIACEVSDPSIGTYRYIIDVRGKTPRQLLAIWFFGSLLWPLYVIKSFVSPVIVFLVKNERVGK